MEFIPGKIIRHPMTVPTEISADEPAKVSVDMTTTNKEKGRKLQIKLVKTTAPILFASFASLEIPNCLPEFRTTMKICKYIPKIVK